MAVWPVIQVTEKLQMIQGHGGNIYQIAKVLGCSPSEILDMSSNVCPLGMPGALKGVLDEKWDEIVSLPEVDSDGLRAGFAASVGLSPNHVIAGNGTTEFIYTIPPALGVKKALIVGPTYSDYADACRAYGIEPLFYLAPETRGFQPDLDEISSMLGHADTVFICNPNNPTGRLMPAKSLIRLIESHPGVRFVIDESYLPFIPDWKTESLIDSEAGNIVVLHSFSKIFAVPGLRLGFLIAGPRIIHAFQPFKQPWSVNRPAQVAGTFLASQKEFVDEVAGFVEKEREAFIGYLQGLDLVAPFSSAINFILFRLNGTLKANDLFSLMCDHRILIRNCSNFPGLSDRFIRIALKSPAANRTCAELIRSVLY